MRIAIAPLELTHLRDESLMKDLHYIVDKTVFILRNNKQIVSQIYAKSDADKASRARDVNANLVIGVTFEESGQPRENYGIKLYTNISGGLAELAGGYIGRELIALHRASDKSWTESCYKGVHETPVNYRHARFLRQAGTPSVIIILGHALNALDRYFYSKNCDVTATAITEGILKYQNSGLRKVIQESDTPKIIAHNNI